MRWTLPAKKMPESSTPASTPSERSCVATTTMTVVSMSGVKQKVAVTLGPKIKTVLVYSTAAPPPPNAAPQGPPPPAAGAVPRPAAPAPTPVSVGPPIPFSATKGEPAPPERGFIAFEPMVAITNALNAAQKGQYKELQTVAPGAFWEESFWVTPTGF